MSDSEHDELARIIGAAMRDQEVSDAVESRIRAKLQHRSHARRKDTNGRTARPRSLLFICLTIMFVGAVVSAVVVGSHPHGAAPTAKSPIAARIDQFAVNASYLNGDTLPKSVTWVLANSSRAGSFISGDLIRQRGVPAYLVVVPGNFILYDFPSPPKAPTPKGHTLWFIIDRATWKVIAFGSLSGAPPSLTSLGRSEFDSLAGMTPTVPAHSRLSN